MGSGELLRADLVIVAAGIAPNTELAKSAGIRVDRGIVVDAHMATSATGVYAVGDVAEFDARVKGLWPVAVEQAEVAARNLLGDKVAYQEPVVSTVLKVVGIDVFSVGQYEATVGDEVVLEEDPGGHTYRKIVMRDGQLLGAVLIGWPSLVDALGKAAKRRQHLGPAVAALKAGDWRCLDGQLLQQGV